MFDKKKKKKSNDLKILIISLIQFDSISTNLTEPKNSRFYFCKLCRQKILIIIVHVYSKQIKTYFVRELEF